METSHSQTYRRELDGFRSIAVLAVVFYHFSTPGFGGGFVGVDIFFVLSGFFIGRLLWIELTETGQISYSKFLYRRLRRLAPAYFLMIVAVSVIAYQVLLPYEYQFFGKELISSTVYLSNVMYFREAGYFDIGSDNKMLLHTWSLSVEEQFYVALPLLMILLAKRRQSLIWVLCLIFAASLAACIVVTQASPTATFFLFPFRAWELLAGVLLAVFGYQRGFSWIVHQALSWAGLALVVGSIAFMPAGKSFPGALAIVPVLGTALIILNGRQQNLINQSLSHPVPVFFGLISYSLYLWHWPVMTLSKYVSNNDLNAADNAGLIGLSILLAWVSWKFVESPFRRNYFQGKVLLIGAALASALSLGSGVVIYLSNGAVERFNPEVRKHLDASSDFFVKDWSRCETADEGIWKDVELCPIGPEGPPKILIWGDSHVLAFKEGLEQAAWEAHIPALLIWHAACPPLFGIEKEEVTATPSQDAACGADNRQIAKALPTLTSVDTILMIGRWTYYVEGTGLGLDQNNRIDIFPSLASPVDGDQRTDVIADAFSHSIEILDEAFRTIFVMRQVPEIPFYSSRDVARLLLHGHLSDDDARALGQVRLEQAQSRSAGADALLASFPHRIRLIDSWPKFCDKDFCYGVREDRVDYFDNSHITNSAARRYRDLFSPGLSVGG